jgi:hypothetical protein
MNKGLPHISHPAWNALAEGCQVVTVLDGGSIEARLRAALESCRLGKQDFIAVRDPDGSFTRRAVSIGGIGQPILGAWFRGSHEELERLRAALNGSNSVGQKRMLLNGLVGKFILLTAACDADGNISEATVICDNTTECAIVNLKMPVTLGGGAFVFAGAKVDGKITPFAALENTSFASILRLNPVISSAHFSLSIQSALNTDTETFEHAVLEVTDKQVRNATWQFGPIYNALNADLYLVPHTLGHSGAAKDAPASFGRFIGLSGFGAGDLGLHFDTASPYPGPLVYPEDITTCLALAFGSPNAQLPRVSLDEIKSPSGSDQFVVLPTAQNLTNKLFDPAWLGSTLLGKTLYATDYWMGRMFAGFSGTQNPPVMSDAAFNGFPEASKLLLQDIYAIPNYTDAGQYYCIVPDVIQANWQKYNGNLHCVVEAMRMRVCGWDSTEKLTAPPSATMPVDLSTRAGRVAAVLTERYDEIAQAWPMYERLRQLTAIFQCAIELRARGFVPNDALKQRLRDHIQRHEGMAKGLPTRNFVTWQLRLPQHSL